MKSNIKNEITVELKLNNEERIWLKHLMQNPLYANHPDNEEQEDKDMRFKFFEAMGDW